ncbi:MAG: tricarballylate dehydrogenase [Betaproteobacteria bacterium RIFCSPLOWO2_12_FULL_62_58]|nr:MAG: tricarballylate dehydrogenase [Betaproteobacteria bacterium RIFCSPLOWO2_12_FULL_62_58]
MQQFDVVVVGKGNAALCAALSARDMGVSVAMLEAASVEESGGNSRFAGGVMRFAYSSVEDLKKITDIPDDEATNTDWDSNTIEEFYDDLYRVTSYRTDPDLSEALITKSLEGMVWLRGQGARFVPNYASQSAIVNGKRKFFGRFPITVSGGGAGLVQDLTNTAVKKGIEIFYETRAVSLIYDGERVLGVRAKSRGKPVEFHARAVVLACGGFEANPEWRTRYLGPGWELAKVRGTRHNLGEGLRMALDIGACPYGNWSGRHAVSWERHAPEFGDVNRSHDPYRHSYPLSIMINAEGKRFVDEGAEFYNYTYAKYGGEVLKQTGQFAWQVFDAKVKPLLKQEYSGRNVTRVIANTLEELAAKLEGVNPEGFLKTVREYNAAVRTDVPFSHAAKDGRCTVGIEPPKSNWANPLDTPPFEAYGVTCGITFTFGGLRINHETGQVLDLSYAPIPGLYAAGEMVGGVFYFNYPAGTGLVSGLVFGRIAGSGAATGARAA